MSVEKVKRIKKIKVPAIVTINSIHLQNRELKRLKQMRDKSISRLIKRHAPIGRGAIVQIEGKHHLRGREIRVEKILVNMDVKGMKPIGWGYLGIVLNKNGEPNRNRIKAITTERFRL